MACKSSVRVVRRKKKIVDITWRCDGTCPNTLPCQLQFSFDHHGDVRVWCGCSPIEPEECHLVIYYPGPGTGGGPPEILCAGFCFEEGKKHPTKQCKPKETVIIKGGEEEDHELVDITCEC